MKWIKYILMFVVGVAVLPFAILIGFGYLTFKLAKYLLNEKKKYKDIKDCFKDIKNIGALIAIIIGVIAVPTGLFKYTMHCFEVSAEGEKKQAIEREIEQNQGEQRVYQKQREEVLTPSKRISKEISNGIELEDTCVLSKEEIEKYNVSDEEISKFEKDRVQAIQDYKDEKIVKEFEKKAKKYASKNTTSTIERSELNKRSEGYGFNEDKTIVTIKGSYRGRTLQLVNIRNSYTIKFDAKTGKVIEADLGKEYIDSAKHPKNTNKNSKK